MGHSLFPRETQQPWVSPSPNPAAAAHSLSLLNSIAVVGHSCCYLFANCWKFLIRMSDHAVIIEEDVALIVVRDEIDREDRASRL
ncbi:hypothetical protein WN944_018348 [Citrus x changshan-huyou]|uniref:Uncharacterized protein n=1 Tax=Citrus x changshan-huyou TaxID=2935761 RepID=A0AAP0LZL3_9ROSI